MAGEQQKVEQRPIPAPAQLLLAGLLAAALAAVGVAFALGRPSGAEWRDFAILLALIVAADRLELYAGREVDVRVASVPMVAAALLLPAPLVLLCGVGFAAHGPRGSIRPLQRVFNGANHALCGLAAWAVAQAIPHAADRTGLAFAAAGLAATLVYAASTWLLLVAVLHLARDLALAQMQSLIPALLVAEIGLGALGIVVAGLWHSQPVLVPLAILPLVLIWTSLRVSELRREASVDVKTGLANARRLRESLAAELDRARRYGRSLSVLVADLDFLRDVNNAHGHLVGDAVLAGIGDVLRAQLRSTDLAARFGGEEFVMLLPETPGPRAAQLAERVRRAVERQPFANGRDGRPVRVTISIGIASYPGDGETDDELLVAADEAVYAAKARGRNRVCAAGETGPVGSVREE